MAELHTLGSGAISQMSEMWRWYTSHVRGGGMSGEAIARSAVAVRVARIKATPSDATANTAEAVLGKLSFTEMAGRYTPEFVAYALEAKRFIHRLAGPPPRAGDLDIVGLHEGQWYTIETNAPSRLLCKTNSSVTRGNSTQVTVYENGYLAGRTETAWYVWLDTKPISANKEAIIQWHDKWQKWIFENVEC